MAKKNKLAQAAIKQQKLLQEIELIHRVGAERHGGAWLQANMRAVEVLWGTPFQPNDLEVKTTVGMIVLKVLDEAKLAGGSVWDRDKKEWVPNQYKTNPANTKPDTNTATSA